LAAPPGGEFRRSHRFNQTFKADQPARLRVRLNGRLKSSTSNRRLC